MQVAHLDDRAVLRIGGADARAYLQDLLTNDVSLLAPGKPLWAGLLSAQGKVLFDMILHDDGDGVLADVLATSAEALARRLTMYRLRRAVTIEVTGARVLAAWGETAGRVSDPRLAGLGERWVEGRGHSLPPAPSPRGEGEQEVGRLPVSSPLPSWGGGWGREDAHQTPTLAYHAHRLALGVPDSIDLLPDKLMWLEANAVELNGVSFTKGCYVGQENTARMHHRDRLRKRLLPVCLHGPAATGDAIMAGNIAAGELRSHADGRGIAYLRLDPVESSAPLTLNGAPVDVVWPDWLPPLPANSPAA